MVLEKPYLKVGPKSPDEKQDFKYCPTGFFYRVMVLTNYHGHHGGTILYTTVPDVAHYYCFAVPTISIVAYLLHVAS